MYVLYKGVQQKSKHKHTVTLSAVAWPSRSPCHRPAVLFRHFRLTMLLFLQGKISACLTKILFLIFLISKIAQARNCVNWNCVIQGLSVSTFKIFMVRHPKICIWSLTFIEPCIVIYFYSITNYIHQCIKFILFGVTLLVSDGLSVHHQEFKTVHTATGICQTDTADCLLASSRQYLFGCCM